MMKKVKKQSILRLAAFITIGMCLVSLAHNNKLSAAQLDQKDRPGLTKLKIKSWLGSINRHLVDSMHKIIKHINRFKTKLDSFTKKIDLKLHRVNFDVNKNTSGIDQLKFDIKSLKKTLKQQGLKFHGLKFHELNKK